MDILNHLRRRISALFSERGKLVDDFCRALERGEGGTTFTWRWDPDSDTRDVESLVADLDEAIRRAPAPFGMDEGYIELAAYGPLPQDYNGVDPDAAGREVLVRESLRIDRYYDWFNGDARDRVRRLLHRVTPSPEAPVVDVGYFPLSGAVTALVKQGRWRPKKPWAR